MTKTIKEIYGRDKTGYSSLVPGAVPKPARLLALAKRVSKTHKEVMNAVKMTSAISLKDVRMFAQLESII